MATVDFIVYGKTGVVIRQGYCHGEGWKSQAINDGETVIIGILNPHRQMIDVKTGEIIDIAEDIYMVDAANDNSIFDIIRENEKTVQKKDEILERMARAEIKGGVK